MARGKHAASAARGRYEAAVEHIDRLTTELADAKLRARLVERDAARAGELERENAELRRRLEAVTGPEIERLRANLEALKVERESDLDAIADAIRPYFQQMVVVTGLDKKLLEILGGERWESIQPGAAYSGRRDRRRVRGITPGNFNAMLREHNAPARLAENRAAINRERAELGLDADPARGTFTVPR